MYNLPRYRVVYFLALVFGAIFAETTLPTCVQALSGFIKLCAAAFETCRVVRAVPLPGRCIKLLQRNGFAVNKPLDQVESKLPANRKFAGM